MDWNGTWQRIIGTLREPEVDQTVLAEALGAARARAPVPVLWLLGKTQAGKTSIIRTLTGSDDAAIGNGFQPCTRSARFYDFPAGMPVLRFLDTRGLGERAYDPSEDIAFCESSAHLVMAVVKISDPGQEAVFDVVRAVRRRHPDWPVLLALTGLHELYPPGAGHPLPYPFDPGQASDSSGWPADIARACQAQRDRLGALAGDAPVRPVLVDLTLPEDGFVPHDYGRDALWSAIEALTAERLRRELLGDVVVRDTLARAAHPHIVGHSLTAGALGAVPVVDLVAVTAVQVKMLHALAALHGERWSRRLAGEFVALLGTGIAGGVVGRMLGKSVVKLVPGWGQTLGAAWGASTSAGVTYAIGKAAVAFLAARKAGAVDAEVVRAAYAEALKDAGRLLVERRDGVHEP